MTDYGFLSLIPPILAIFLAIRTKQVIFSLLLGITIGWIIIYPKINNDIAGAVLIELVDNNTKKLIWQSSIDANQTMKKRKEKDPLKKIVIHLFNTYLYQAGNPIPDEQLKIK